MIDRVPTYPGRVVLTPVSGQANTYDLTRADDPTEAGTPLNKATLLSDNTALMFDEAGMTLTDETVSEALEMLASVSGNLAPVVAELVSYTGTGTNGATSPCAITFSFDPDVIFALGYWTGTTLMDLLGGASNGKKVAIPSLMSNTYALYSPFTTASTATTSYGKYDATTHEMSWYRTGSSQAEAQLNTSGYVYYFLAIKGV